MQTIDETKLNWRERLVLQKYSDKPWRPEKLFEELKHDMSRPTFYRAHRLLSDNFDENDRPHRRLSHRLIYAISENEKRQFGLVDQQGIVYKGRFYFKRDELKLQKWNKIMHKVSEYTGDKSPYYLIRLIQSQFSEFPFVTVDNVTRIVRTLGMAPKDDINNSRREMLKFLELQVDRLKSNMTDDERNMLSSSIEDLFKFSSEELLGTSGGNVDEHQNKAFDILCNIYGQDDGLNTIETLLKKDVEESKEEVKNQLISDLMITYSKHFNATGLKAYIKEKIAYLDDQEVELSLEDPRKVIRVAKLRDILVQTLNEIKR